MINPLYFLQPTIPSYISLLYYLDRKGKPMTMRDLILMYKIEKVLHDHFKIYGGNWYGIYY